MQFFLAQVEQGKDIVCACLRGSAVKKFWDSLMKSAKLWSGRMKMEKSFL
jgi:hypothetical protein